MVKAANLHKNKLENEIQVPVSTFVLLETQIKMLEKFRAQYHSSWPEDIVNFLVNIFLEEFDILAYKNTVESMDKGISILEKSYCAFLKEFWVRSIARHACTNTYGA